jgi:beta-1,4-N-acetylglucosaminyltransferase
MGLTLVTVGNGHQPFLRLLDGVMAIADKLPRPLIVQSGHTSFSSSEAQVLSFMDRDEFVRVLREASLVISHAGAGSIIEAATEGHVPVVVPRLARYGEIVDDHQLELVSALGEAKKIIPVLDLSRLEAATKEAMSYRRSGARRSEPALLVHVAKCLDNINAKQTSLRHET